ncbi:MAG: hypothetical protein JNK82_05330 [Myxococcaceae bacterium]|nr:hypothetical protein [Myxococcaceae bacterium]
MRLALVLLLLLLLLSCARRLDSNGCPIDLLAAVGSDCSADGKVCSGGSDVRFVMCSSGKWVEMAATPPPPAQ